MWTRGTPGIRGSWRSVCAAFRFPGTSRPAGRSTCSAASRPATTRTWSIRRPYGEIIRHTDDGIPYVAIEATLLFKAKHTREKDEADFTGVLPLLSRAERGWLDAILGLVHPDHPWRARLRR